MLKQHYLMRWNENYGVFPTPFDFIDWIVLRQITEDQIKEIEYAKVPENYIYFGLPAEITIKWESAADLIQNVYYYKHMYGYSTTFGVTIRGAHREIEVYQFYVMYIKSELPNSGPPESLEELKAADAIHLNPDDTSYVYWLNP